MLKIIVLLHIFLKTMILQDLWMHRNSKRFQTEFLTSLLSLLIHLTQSFKKNYVKATFWYACTYHVTFTRFNGLTGVEKLDIELTLNE